VPFQFIVEPFTKLAPFTVSVNAAPPAVVEFGVMPLMIGAGFTAFTVNASADDVTTGRGICHRY
jgi:hypothetical protein